MWPKLSMIAYSVSTAAAAAAGVACGLRRERGSWVGDPSLLPSLPYSSCSLACSLPVHYRNDQAALRGSLTLCDDENSRAACTPGSKEREPRFPRNARKNRGKNRIRRCSVSEMHFFSRLDASSLISPFPQQSDKLSAEGRGKTEEEREASARPHVGGQTKSCLPRKPLRRRLARKEGRGEENKG